ncbi:MAG: S41 family peptidase [Pseudoflavonifractor sp.]|nr:S41 family peptidase [Pseudoflavonifractor sp.]
MQPNFRKASTWMPIAIAVSLAAGFWLGLKLPRNAGADGSASQSKIASMMDIIKAVYVDEIDTDSLLEEAMPDIIAKLDPHSVYIPAADLQTVNDELEGSFSGIGVAFTMLSDTITINEIVSGGPAERVGLMAGDRIVTIDDSVAVGWEQNQVLKTLRGVKGSTVTLGVKRASAPGKLLPFTVTRDDIPVTSIDAQYIIAPGTGFIRVNKFGRTTYDEFFTALQLLSNAGARRFIIDLRGNSGGFLEVANMMANEFLPAGAGIVSMQGRDEEFNDRVYANGHGSFQDAELVVLLDEYSASSSEVFAGAIQDNDRGLVIGRRSFGKGLVQRQLPLPDSSALRITTARYYTPSGRCIQKSYKRGDAQTYEMDLYERMNHGETLSADSIHLDKSVTFLTTTGREVYGGGGIMPDIFVPVDTSGYSRYYFNVVNGGLMQKFAFTYSDAMRERLSDVALTEQLLERLPSDQDLLTAFVDYARREGGVAPQWYYINISRDFIVRQLKALIARDIIGLNGYYEAINMSDPSVGRALKELQAGHARAPITPSR